MTAPYDDDDELVLGNFEYGDVERDLTPRDASAIVMTSYRDPYSHRVTEVVSDRPGVRRLTHSPTARYRERTQQDATWRSTGARYSAVLRPVRRR